MSKIATKVGGLNATWNRTCGAASTTLSGLGLVDNGCYGVLTSMFVGIWAPWNHVHRSIYTDTHIMYVYWIHAGRPSGLAHLQPTTGNRQPAPAQPATCTDTTGTTGTAQPAEPAQSATSNPAPQLAPATSNPAPQLAPATGNRHRQPARATGTGNRQPAPATADRRHRHP